MRTPAERASNTETARRARHRKWLAVNAGRTKCAYRIGPLAVCGGRLDLVADWIGRLHPKCGLCERKRSGICRLCPRKVNGKVGWAIYCADCKRTQALPAQRKRWIAKPYNLRHKVALNRAYRKRKARAVA